MSAERIQNLEERIAWLERHVTQQDKAMLEMADTLAAYRKELNTLRQRVAGAEMQGNEPAVEEPPPHY